MNRPTRNLILVPTTLILCLTGCASTKQWSATGGNREQGLVKLSYQYPEFHQPSVDDAQAQELAARRCAAWGYKQAQPIEGLVRACSKSDGGNCNVWTVTREYQCTGGDASYASRLSK